MKFLLPLVTILMTASVAASAQQNTPQSVRRLLKEFPDPDKTFRTVPFMVWNTDVTRERIDAQLDAYRKQGCGGVFIHPRLGLITEYLSEDWVELVHYTIDQGRKKGIDVWLYDENSYPSGFAGGHVPRQMPESFNQGQGLQPQNAEMIPEKIDDCYLILSQQGDQFVNVTASAASLKGKPGKYIIYRKTFYQPSPWYAGGPYVDLLAKGVTRKFMEVTMNGYEKRFDHNLNRHIKGIFTDEPEIVSPGGVRWTPDLFEVFQQTYGYDLKTSLPMLHEETGDWQRIRHDYFSLLNRLFVDRWAKPWYEYCEKNHVAWTGHYWEHNWPAVTGVTDNMSMAAWQQIPGIDMLFNQFNEQSVHAQFGNIRSVKEVVSIANQLGRHRVLSETYGGAGWNVTFKDMKRLADWEMVLGVNLINQHVGHMSMAGVRKFDYPPMFNPSACWWEDYHVLNDYIARICAAMSMGEQRNEVLVMEPTTSVWMYNQYCGTPSADRAGDIGQAFQQLVTQLEHAQVEFDLGCESVFDCHGAAEKGKLVVGQREYKTFVIPPRTENIERKTFDLLRRFTAQGGQLIALAQPDRIDGMVSPEAKAFFASDKVIRAAECTPELINRYMSTDDIRFPVVSGGDLHHNRREFADGQTLLLVNASMDQPTEVQVTLKGQDVARMDALDGKTYEIPFTTDADRVMVKTRIEPAGSILIHVSPDQIPDKSQEIKLSGGEEVPWVDKLKLTRLRDNVLLIDFLDLTQGDKQYRDIYYNNACTEVFKNAGLQNNPWAGAMQYKREIMNIDLSNAPGFTAVYSFNALGNKVDWESIKILVERPENYTVTVNGTEVKADPDDWMKDVDFKIIPVGKLVREGENKIELCAERPSVLTELAAVYVLGNFDVVDVNDRWVIVPRRECYEFDRWNEVGAPFYPWEISYAKMFRIDDMAGSYYSYYVNADHWIGSLVEIWVNGKKAGIVFADPYRLDVSPYLQKGLNQVEMRVMGNMENFFGPHHKNYDGMVHPGCWNVAKRPKASEYIVTPFGLRDDFELMRVAKK